MTLILLRYFIKLILVNNTINSVNKATSSKEIALMHKNIKTMYVMSKIGDVQDSKTDPYGGD